MSKRRAECDRRLCRAAGKFGATLDGAGRRDAAEFQAKLLAAVPALRGYALSPTRDPGSADELVQEILMRAWHGRSRFQIGTHFEA
ncbi:sigma factor [Methylobacterium sp. P31]